MKNTEIKNMNLAPEVTAELNKYNSAVDNALEAVQKLEALCVTKRLAEMFGTQEAQTSKLIKEDYLVAA